MDIATLRSMSDEELQQQLATSGEQIFRVRFQKSMGNLEGIKALREQRRVIAKVKTLQRERELGVQGTQVQGTQKGGAA